MSQQQHQEQEEQHQEEDIQQHWADEYKQQQQQQEKQQQKQQEQQQQEQGVVLLASATSPTSAKITTVEIAADGHVLVVGNQTGNVMVFSISRECWNEAVAAGAAAKATAAGRSAPDAPTGSTAAAAAANGVAATAVGGCGGSGGGDKFTSPPPPAAGAGAEAATAHSSSMSAPSRPGPPRYILPLLHRFKAVHGGSPVRCVLPLAPMLTQLVGGGCSWVFVTSGKDGCLCKFTVTSRKHAGSCKGSSTLQQQQEQEGKQREEEQRLSAPTAADSVVVVLSGVERLPGMTSLEGQLQYKPAAAFGQQMQIIDHHQQQQQERQQEREREQEHGQQQMQQKQQQEEEGEQRSTRSFEKRWNHNSSSSTLSLASAAAAGLSDAAAASHACNIAPAPAGAVGQTLCIGFRSMEFVAWDEKSHVEAMSVECGGSRRPFSFWCKEAAGTPATAGSSNSSGRSSGSGISSSRGSASGKSCSKVLNRHMQGGEEEAEMAFCYSKDQDIFLVWRMGMGKQQGGVTSPGTVTAVTSSSSSSSSDWSRSGVDLELGKGAGAAPAAEARFPHPAAGVVGQKALAMGDTSDTCITSASSDTRTPSLVVTLGGSISLSPAHHAKEVNTVLLLEAGGEGGGWGAVEHHSQGAVAVGVTGRLPHEAAVTTDVAVSGLQGGTPGSLGGLSGVRPGGSSSSSIRGSSSSSGRSFALISGSEDGTVRAVVMREGPQTTHTDILSSSSSSQGHNNNSTSRSSSNSLVVIDTLCLCDHASGTAIKCLAAARLPGEQQKWVMLAGGARELLMAWVVGWEGRPQTRQVDLKTRVAARSETKVMHERTAKGVTADATSAPAAAGGSGQTEYSETHRSQEQQQQQQAWGLEQKQKESGVDVGAEEVVGDGKELPGSGEQVFYHQLLSCREPARGLRPKSHNPGSRSLEADRRYLALSIVGVSTHKPAEEAGDVSRWKTQTSSTSTGAGTQQQHQQQQVAVHLAVARSDAVLLLLRLDVPSCSWHTIAELKHHSRPVLSLATARAYLQPLGVQADEGLGQQQQQRRKRQEEQQNKKQGNNQPQQQQDQHQQPWAGSTQEEGDLPGQQAGALTLLVSGASDGSLAVWDLTAAVQGYLPPALQDRCFEGASLTAVAADGGCGSGAAGIGGGTAIASGVIAIAAAGAAAAPRSDVAVLLPVWSKSGVHQSGVNGLCCWLDSRSSSRCGASSKSICNQSRLDGRHVASSSTGKISTTCSEDRRSCSSSGGGLGVVHAELLVASGGDDQVVGVTCLEISVGRGIGATDASEEHSAVVAAMEKGSWSEVYAHDSAVKGLAVCDSLCGLVCSVGLDQKVCLWQVAREGSSEVPNAASESPSSKRIGSQVHGGLRLQLLSQGTTEVTEPGFLAAAGLQGRGAGGWAAVGGGGTQMVPVLLE